MFRPFRRLRKVVDAVGHSHDALGRFGTGGSKKDPNAEKTPRQRAEDSHTDHDTGAVDHEAAIADRMSNGEFDPLETDERHAVFMIGGGGSGKGGSVTRYYVGNLHKKDKEGATPMKRHAPQPGFHSDRVIDSDAIKAKMPLYSFKTGVHPSIDDEEDARPEHSGLYGPSGPKNAAELARYSPQEQAAMQKWIQDNTGFQSAEDFIRNNPDPDIQAQNADGRAQNYGGGLTHELSSYIAKKKLRDALADPQGKSFVYDSTGSANYADRAREAMAAGYHVIFHHVNTPREVAHYRNQGRARTVDPDLLNGTHEKVQRIVPGLAQFVKAAQAAGGRINWRKETPWDKSELQDARDAGFTEKGPPQGYVSPKKLEARQRKAAERAAKPTAKRRQSVA
jgi:predicted kinase